MRKVLLTIGVICIAIFMVAFVTSAILFMIPMTTAPGTMPHRALPIILIIADRIAVALLLIGVACGACALAND